MRAMLNDNWEAWPHILNTDQQELDSMKGYWEDLYFDVPDELLERYHKALELMYEVTREISALAPKRKVENEVGGLRFEWVEDELSPKH